MFFEAAPSHTNDQMNSSILGTVYDNGAIVNCQPIISTIHQSSIKGGNVNQCQWSHLCRNTCVTVHFTVATSSKFIGTLLIYIHQLLAESSLLAPCLTATHELPHHLYFCPWIGFPIYHHLRVRKHSNSNQQQHLLHGLSHENDIGPICPLLLWTTHWYSLVTECSYWLSPSCWAWWLLHGLCRTCQPPWQCHCHLTWLGVSWLIVGMLFAFWWIIVRCMHSMT